MRSERPTRRPRLAVLLFGPNPCGKHTGGVAKHMEYLEQVCRTEALEVRWLYTDGHVPSWMPGTIDRLIGTVAAAWTLWRHRREQQVLHLNATLSPAGGFRIAILTLASRLAGVPLLLQLHGGRFERIAGHVAAERIWRLLLSTADVVGAFPGPQAEELSQAGMNAKLKLLTNVVAGTHAGSNRPEVEPRFLFLGRMVPEKGPQRVLKAFIDVVAPEVPTASLTLAGGGPLVDDCRAAVHDAGLNARVTVTGHLEGGALQGVLRSHNIMVLPSTHLEGLPLSFLECASHGMACIATTNSAIPSLFDEGVEYLATTIDPLDLAERMALLARDSSQRVRMGTAVQQKIASSFTIAAAGRQYVQIYRTLAAHRSGTSGH